VAREVYLWEATRVGADESCALRSWGDESNTKRKLYFNVADRIMAILRTPRGEGEAEPVAWRVEFRPRGEIEWQRLGTYDYPDIATDRALILSSSGRMECRIVPLYPAGAYNEAHAARRGEGGGDDA